MALATAAVFALVFLEVVYIGVLIVLSTLRRVSR